MLINYLKTAWRNLLRNRTLSLINLAGLSISVAFCLLLFFHIRYEQSYDTFHVKKDRLFRCEATNLFPNLDGAAKKGLFSWLDKDDQVKNSITWPLIVGRDMQSTFPEVASITRWRADDEELVRAGKNMYKERAIIHADDNFFRNLTFPLLKGNPKTALAEPGNVVLSASTARKYFGNQDPIGQTISLVSEDERPFKVTGISADAPGNSSIQYNMVLPLKSEPGYQDDIEDRFNQWNHYLLIELKPGTDRAAFTAKMNGWMRNYYKPSLDSSEGKRVPAEIMNNYRWFLRPLADCHYNASTRWGHYTDAGAIYQLLCIVAVILLLASLNYVLITVSNAAARSQEIGVRKVMGAGRSVIILQSWLETQLVVVMAVGFGLILAFAGVPLLRMALGSGITRANLSWTEVFVASMVLAVVLGLLAGYYPALLISQLKPLSIIKSFSTFRINPRFSRLLVVVQFTCCIVLMMAAFVIDRQMEFVNNKDLGFDKEQVLMVHNPTWDFDFTARVKDRLYAFARTQPSILSYSSMNGGLTGEYNTNGFLLNGQQQWMRELTVDYDYFEMLGLKLVQGRSFSREYTMDSARSVRACVVNETMMRLLGKGARLGVFNEAIHGTIIGVVKDYNFETLTKKIEPEEHRLVGKYAGEFLFKVRAGQMQATIAALEREWKTITNNYPFEYTFLDQTIAQMYEADLHWQKAVRAACFFAILIACMGLFGLSAINAVNRTKEIGIRKVLGAEIADIVMTLSSGLLGMVVVSIIIAAPLAWWLMNKWLEDFAYRIEIRWWMFVVVGLAAVAIAFGTVSYQVIRAARANPVRALRAE